MMQHTAPEAPAEFRTTATACVLVVDDEPAIAQMLAFVLERQGYCVRTATSGPEAVELYQRQHADIDLVLLDVQMPELDGPQTAERLRRINPEVRFCFMTGNIGRYSHSELVDRLGAERVFDKPFSPGRIACEMRELLATA